MTASVNVDRTRRVHAALSALGLEATDKQIAQLLAYVDQLQRWNRTYNLTAIRDPEQMLVQHLFDSLAVVAPLARELPGPGAIGDVGSGAGLPGVVLAIMRPTWQVTCVDAVEKKTAFVRQVGGVLELANLRAMHARIEQVQSCGWDLAISRAFASLDDFTTLAGPHVREDAALVAMKGKRPDEEIAGLHAKGIWNVEEIETLTVPELPAQRCLIWMRRATASQGNT
jgi:16S rRNA (guanine527-N7)-methyltransferase